MPSPSLPFLSASRLPNSCDRKNATEECRVRDSMTRAASLLCLAIVVSLLPIGAALAAVDRPKLERAFADWIEDDVWPAEGAPVLQKGGRRPAPSKRAAAYGGKSWAASGGGNRASARRRSRIMR